MTQRQLAGNTLSVSYVSLLESGRRTPTAGTVRLLADALGCAPEELLGQRETEAGRPAALRVRYGQLAMAAGHVEQAQQHFDAALAAPQLDPLLRAEALIGRARVLEAQGRLREASQSYESLVQSGLESPRYRASLEVAVHWCRCLYELGDLSRVVEVGTSAMRELDRLQAWQSDNAIGLVATVAAAHVELGDLREAERLLREGLIRADEVPSPGAARSAVLWNASQVASDMGRQREALELAEEALAHLRRGQDRLASARLLSQYGHLLLQQDPPRVEDATRTLLESLAVLRQDGDTCECGHVLTELSRASLLAGRLGDAVDFAEESLAQWGPEAALGRARAQTALAAAVAAGNDRDRAAELFDRAASTLRELPASRQAARAWVELGNMLERAGDVTGAVRAFREAMSAQNVSVPVAVPPRSELTAD